MRKRDCLLHLLLTLAALLRDTLTFIGLGLRSRSALMAENLFAGNRKFITRKLWGIANQHSFGHHGQYTTMRDAVLSHHGEAKYVTNVFNTLPAYDRDSIIEFLKSLQILTPATLGVSTTVQILRQPRSLCVDENHRDIACPAGVLP